jgi:hypothetical protein
MARASEAPALSLLCARRVTRWKYPHLRLGCDSENGSALVYQVPGVLRYLTSRRGKLKEKGRMRHARRQAAEGQRSRMRHAKRRARAETPAVSEC